MLKVLIVSVLHVCHCQLCHLGPVSQLGPALASFSPLKMGLLGVLNETLLVK